MGLVNVSILRIAIVVGGIVIRYNADEKVPLGQFLKYYLMLVAIILCGLFVMGLCVGPYTFF